MEDIRLIIIIIVWWAGSAYVLTGVTSIYRAILTPLLGGIIGALLGCLLNYFL